MSNFVQKFWVILTLSWTIAKFLVPLALRIRFGQNESRQQRRKESNMFALTEQKAALVEALKETEDFIKLQTHIEEIVIRVLTDDKKQAWYLELSEILTAVVAECSQEAVDAFTGCTNIPAEWKAASKEDIAQFVLETLVAEGKLIIGLFIPKK